jgi:hypothetical protein
VLFLIVNVNVNVNRGCCRFWGLILGSIYSPRNGSGPSYFSINFFNGGGILSGFCSRFGWEAVIRSSRLNDASAPEAVIGARR